VIDAHTRILLEDMRDHANDALNYIGGLDVEIFSETRVMIHAATRAAEIVGEAASQIKSDVRQANPSIPWRRIIDMRNKLIHGYRSLQPKTLFETIHNHFPPLIAEIERLLNANP
jgi:uncharacterized protein with HEPN domain